MAQLASVSNWVVPTSNSILMKKFTASIRIGAAAKASPLKFPHQRGSDQRAGNAIVQKNKKVRNRNSQTLDRYPIKEAKYAIDWGEISS